jgi:transglutaminase-like putative cysteine protease/predicted glutamine amidotransferase
MPRPEVLTVSELLALSFDADASPSIRFRDVGETVRQGAGVAPQPGVFGWGIGWYPDSERGASVVKDPTSAGESRVSGVLSDWRRFRSTLYVCHLRGHQRRRAQQDAQPFVRSYGGRQWIFAHDGDLDPRYAEWLSLEDDPAFEPLGRTDSEHAFCWLLSRLRDQRARSLADLDPGLLRHWLDELNRLGRVNAVVSDGDLLAVYRDAQARGGLSWTRRIPPHPTTHLESDAVVVELDSPEDPNRTALVFSSVPLTQDRWLPMSPGQLVLARRGSVVWDTDPQQTSAPPPPTQPAVTMRSEATHQVAASLPVVSEVGHAADSVPAFRRLQIFHETHYQYDSPVERSSHRVLLRPVEDRLQGVASYSFEIDPLGDTAEYEDVFGNVALGLEISAPYSNLTIRTRATVVTQTPEPLERRVTPRRQTLPLVWMPWQRQMLAAYLLPQELPETQLQELSDFAMSFVGRNDSDLVGTLLDMNKTLYQDFEYVTGSTHIATTPFEVFESRRGVCQDFANLMICMARLLNVPARYRMGYIFTGADYENQVQSEASHAWVELYVPRLGWHGFDPTNGRQAGSEHVRVACGRNYRDATPTSGTIYRGGGMETLRVTVRVEDVTGSPATVQ